jgi:hypothetical protein
MGLSAESRYCYRPCPIRSEALIGYQAQLPNPPHEIIFHDIPSNIKLTWVKDRDIVKEDVFWGKDPNNLSLLETSAVSSTAWQECHQDHDGDQGQDV